MDSDDRTRRFRQWKSLCMKDLGIKSMASTRGVRASSKPFFQGRANTIRGRYRVPFFAIPDRTRVGFRQSSPIRTGRKEFPISPGRRVHPGRAPPGDPEMNASEITQYHEALFQIMGNDFRNIDFTLPHMGADTHERFAGSKSGGHPSRSKSCLAPITGNTFGSSRPKRPIPIFRPKRKCDA